MALELAPSSVLLLGARLGGTFGRGHALAVVAGVGGVVPEEQLAVEGASLGRQGD